MRAGAWRLGVLFIFIGAGIARADVAVFKEGAATPFVGGTYSGAEDAMLVDNNGQEARAPA